MGVKEIPGIGVVDSWRYLKVDICNKRDIFKVHKENAVKKLEGGACGLRGVIEKSCNKLLVGNLVEMWYSFREIIRGWGYELLKGLGQ